MRKLSNHRRPMARNGEHSPPDTSVQPMAVVAQCLHYFAQHFSDAIAIDQLASTLGIPQRDLDGSFDQVRGMTPAQALLEHRLNQLFTALTDRPRQGLGNAIRGCGLGQTAGVVVLFEQTFGIEMPLFLLTCRRAADDRLSRKAHPEPEALVLGV